MSDALPLPPRPNLDQYKKLAKDLRDACRSGDAEAIHDWATRWLVTLARLRGDQDAPGFEHGWQHNSAGVARRWMKTHESDGREAAGKRACTLTDAQFFVAREHGFASWPKFAAHLAGLAQKGSPVDLFEHAADAIVTGDAQTLGRLLRAHRRLARARSTRDHRSTLLHYVAANGIEDFRQRTPANIVSMAEMLIAAGADVNATSEAYGGKSTTLGLAATSAHPNGAGVQIELLETLLRHGARIDEEGLVRGSLANGQGGAARFLAGRGAKLGFFEAAGVGRVDILATFTDEHGALRAQISDAQRSSAFLHACGYGQTEAVRFLLDHGVDVGVRDERGETGLHWASYGPHVEVAKLLVDRGGPIQARDAVWNATPLDWLIDEWSKTTNQRAREHACKMAALLVAAGAKFDVEHADARIRDAVRADADMRTALGNRE
jgi:ankyrin repeat protein